MQFLVWGKIEDESIINTDLILKDITRGVGQGHYCSGGEGPPVIGGGGYYNPWKGWEARDMG